MPRYIPKPVGTPRYGTTGRRSCCSSLGRRLSTSGGGDLTGHPPSRWLVFAFVGAGAFAIAAVSWRFGWSAALAAYLFVVAVGLVVSWFDAAEGRIPNRIVLPSYPIAFGLLAIAAAHAGRWDAYAHAAIAMGISLVVYLLLSSIRSGLGMGDVKLAGLLGVFLAYLGWNVFESGVVAGLLIGALSMLVLRLVRHAPIPTMPFAPSMVAGALVAIVLLG